MADLDDFFAKKDRKKSKTNKKFSTTDEVAKKLEDTAKKTEKLKKERVPEGGDEQTAPVHEQDEWKDFEEEKKDYTGLKIGQLNINSKDESHQQGPQETNVEQQSGGEETGPEYDRKAGPWKRMDEQQQQQQQQVVEEKVEKKPEPAPEPQRAKGGAYVPPNLRNASQQPAVQSSRYTKTKAAPDIHNEEFFPTLSKGGDHKKNRSEGSFEVVQHNRSSSYRQSEQSKLTSTQGPKLSLGNRYNTLSNDS